MLVNGQRHGERRLRRNLRQGPAEGTGRQVMVVRRLGGRMVLVVARRGDAAGGFVLGGMKDGRRVREQQRHEGDRRDESPQDRGSLRGGSGPHRRARYSGPEPAATTPGCAAVGPALAERRLLIL